MIPRPDFTFRKWQDFSDALYKALPSWLAFLISAYLWGLEQRVIAYKARKAVDDAILPVAPPEPVIEAPRYHSEPSEVEGLDTIGFTYEFTRTRSQDERRLPSLPDTGVERT